MHAHVSLIWVYRVHIDRQYGTYVENTYALVIKVVHNAEHRLLHRCVHGVVNFRSTRYGFYTCSESVVAGGVIDAFSFL